MNHYSNITSVFIRKHFPGNSNGKETACKAGDLASILGLGRFPGEANGNPLQCSSLGNPMVRGPDGRQSMGLQESRHD